MPVDFTWGRMCNLVQVGEVVSRAIRESLYQCKLNVATPNHPAKMVIIASDIYSFFIDKKQFSMLV